MKITPTLIATLGYLIIPLSSIIFLINIYHKKYMTAIQGIVHAIMTGVVFCRIGSGFLVTDEFALHFSLGVVASPSLFDGVDNRLNN
jgi:anthranilate phosphoribosyltransferase